MNQDHVDTDIGILVNAIKDFGSVQSDGSIAITFGKLYEETVDVLEVIDTNLTIECVFYI